MCITVLIIPFVYELIHNDIFQQGKKHSIFASFNKCFINIGFVHTSNNLFVSRVTLLLYYAKNSMYLFYYASYSTENGKQILILFDYSFVGKTFGSFFVGIGKMFVLLRVHCSTKTFILLMMEEASRDLDSVICNFACVPNLLRTFGRKVERLRFTGWRKFAEHFESGAKNNLP